MGAFLETNAASQHDPWYSKTGGYSLPQHIGHNKKPHMATPDIDLVEMRDSSVARGDSDVFQLDVHIILGWGRSD